MILKAKETDRAAVKEIWKTCFPKEDPEYIEFYFKTIWTPESCYMNVADGEIVSVVCRNRHVLLYNGRIINVSFLTGMATIPSARGRGHMHDLMNVVIDACEHSELLTFVRTENPSLYEPFGFRLGFERTAYVIQRADLKRVPTFGCAYDVQALDMLKVYSAYIRRFNGFYIRDLKHFVDYKKEIVARDGKIIGHFDSKDEISGYAAVTFRGADLYVDELVYLDSISLIKLLNVCLAERPRVHFDVSKAENLEGLFPQAKKTNFETTMMRVNNYELFNKVFNVRVTNVREALQISARPLNQNEAY